MTMARIAPCLWFNGNAEEAARFYARTFPDSHVDAVHRAPGDYPAGKAGDVLTVEFTVLGMNFVGLNGGSAFSFTEAVSFQVFTDDQAETDRYWNALIADGGQPSQCSWCKDRFGLSWQNRAAPPGRADERPRHRACQACDERDDADAEDRHRRNRACSRRTLKGGLPQKFWTVHPEQTRRLQTGLKSNA